MVTRKFVIGVTGTPGSGKSSFAKRLHSKLADSSIFEVNAILKSGNAISGKDADGTLIADLKKLGRLVNSAVSGSNSRNIILVGHLVQELGVRFDMIIVIRLNINELDKRLRTRGYGKHKRSENLVSEALDYCGAQSLTACKKVYELEADSDKQLFLSSINRGKILSTSIKQFKATENKPQIKELLKFIKSNRKLGL